ncbi:DUF3791 domain-containing protein [Clostridium botulinum]|uniref:DUF3791 domain-containing protein n=1 Tax=Clostridium botulinum TaxID=1491 RepID=UPI000A6CB528|nr:DUF3791 domain-containing protein [Clostridium botulinum]KAI3345643.1 DUF3791 domain-containing protein [Clostridium botulinum]
MRQPNFFVYFILNQSTATKRYDKINNRIKCYDVLHTLGKEYLMEDITELIRERGIKL